MKTLKAMTVAFALVLTISATSSAAQAAPLCDGRKATLAIYAGGAFVDQGNGEWVERNFDSIFRFEEAFRTATSVYLIDAPRGVLVVLDLNTMEVLYADTGSRPDLEFQYKLLDCNPKS